jgi:hypothetical protein
MNINTNNTLSQQTQQQHSEQHYSTGKNNTRTPQATLATTLSIVLGVMDPKITKQKNKGVATEMATVEIVVASYEALKASNANRSIRNVKKKAGDRVSYETTRKILKVYFETGSVLSLDPEKNRLFSLHDEWSRDGHG